MKRTEHLRPEDRAARFSIGAVKRKKGDASARPPTSQQQQQQRQQRDVEEVQLQSLSMSSGANMKQAGSVEIKWQDRPPIKCHLWLVKQEKTPAVVDAVWDLVKTTHTLEWQLCLPEEHARALFKDAAATATSFAVFKLIVPDIDVNQTISTWIGYMSERRLTGFGHFGKVVLFTSPKSGFSDGGGGFIGNEPHIFAFLASDMPTLKWRYIEPETDFERYTFKDRVKDSLFFIYGPSTRSTSEVRVMLLGKMGLKEITEDELLNMTFPTFIFVHYSFKRFLHLLPHYINLKRSPTTRFITYGYNPAWTPSQSDLFQPILRGGGFISFDYSALSSLEGLAMLHATKLFVDHCAVGVPFEEWQIVLHSGAVDRIREEAGRGNERAKRILSTIDHIHKGAATHTLASPVLRMFDAAEEERKETKSNQIQVALSLMKCGYIHMDRCRRIILVTGDGEKWIYAAGVEVLTVKEFTTSGIPF